MNKKTITDIDVKGKKCLVRVDFNVPMKDGVITDENRIIGALPTIKYLMEHGAKVVLCSHMGKPHNVFDDKIKLNKKEKAKIEALPEEERAAATAEAIEKAKKDVKKFSLAPVAARLNELLDNKVTFATDVIGPDAKAKVAALKDGECVLLETCVSTPAKKAGTKTSARLLPNMRTFTSTTLSVRRTVRTRRQPLSSNTVL